MSAKVNDLENETIRFSAKPSPLLYALEATRFYWFVFFFVFAAIVIFYIRGVPLRTSLEIGGTLYCLSYLVLFAGTVFWLAASGLL
jgi:hypothetical protein